MAATKTAKLVTTWDWKAVLAAMLYLASFIAGCFAIYAAAQNAPFFESFVTAYPLAFLACGVFFICSAAIETLRAAVKKNRAAEQVTAHSSASSF